MLRFTGQLGPLHQGHEGFLQDVLGFPVTQPQRAAIKNEGRGFRLVERFKPFGIFDTHDFTL